MQLLTSCVDYLDKESDTELTLPMVFEDKTAAGFMALIVRIVKNIFQQAIDMKSELDLTI